MQLILLVTLSLLCLIEQEEKMLMLSYVVIYRPEIKELNGVLYCNDGDWIESCTALVEDEVGNLSILNWPEEREKLKLVSKERRKIKEDAA